MRIIEIKAMNCIVSQNCLINCLDPKDLEETLPGDAIHMKTQRHTQTDTHTHRPDTQMWELSCFATKNKLVLKRSLGNFKCFKLMSFFLKGGPQISKGGEAS